MDDAAPLPSVARATHAVAFVAAVALIVLGVGWELWFAPTGSGTLAVKVLPLALALPGLARMRLYTYRWVSLAVLLYVAEGAVRATTEPGASAILAAVELLLALVLFAACCIHVRARLRAGSAAPAQP